MEGGVGTKLALLAVTALTASAAAVGTSQTYRGHGVAFEYPDRWSAVRPTAATAQVGAQVWSQWFAPVRTGSADLVIVAGYRLPVEITPATLAAVRPSITAAIRGLARQSGGRLVSGPVAARLGRLPGFRYEITARAANGTAVRSILYLAFRKRDEFFLNCQWARAGSRSGEVRAGCARIVRSFRTTG
jgi:hypothetical protein